MILGHTFSCCQHKIDHISFTGKSIYLEDVKDFIQQSFNTSESWINESYWEKGYRLDKGLYYQHGLSLQIEDNHVWLYWNDGKDYLCQIGGKALETINLSSQFRLAVNLYKSEFVRRITRIDLKRREFKPKKSHYFYAAKAKSCDTTYITKGVYIPESKESERIYFVYDPKDQHGVNDALDIEVRLKYRTATRFIKSLSNRDLSEHGLRSLIEGEINKINKFFE